MKTTKSPFPAAALVVALFATLAFASQSDDKKKKKDEPIKTEIAADAAKIRAALIKAEMDEGYELGDEQPSRIIFREREKSPTSFKRMLLTGDSHVRDVFVIASTGNTSTVYATTEMCIQMRGGFGTQIEGRYDPRYRCNTIDMRKNKNEKRNHYLNRLEKLLESAKTEASR